MCGIVGWMDWNTDAASNRNLLENMTETLAPRGPDDTGLFFSGGVALGHRRLAVVDPASGRQPMTISKGEHACTIVYNGELYNTEEIRRELLARGHRFRGHSDTEVLLAAYVEWGQSCLEKLNGIFAFAIWDEREQRLFLARDRLGVKPLFYTSRGGAFFFASELKALLAHPAIQPEVDEEGLAEVFLLGPARTPGHGVFRGISELRPGRWMEVSRQGVRIQTYWSLTSRPHTDDLETTAETVRTLLTDAIERQLVSDVPLGTLLSGGLDSSAITAVAAAAFRRDGRGTLPTYSVDFVDNHRHFAASEFMPDDDAPWINRVRQQLGTNHTRFAFDTPELVEALKTAVLARDLPGMTDIDASLYLFCREIKKETTVVLSGECADEVFGGYPWFYRKDALEAGTFPWARMNRERVRWLSPELKHRLRPYEYVAQRYSDTLAEVPRLDGETPEEHRRREMAYLNLTWFMSTLLDRKDRMSMRASLEARVPFSDHRLVEYVWNIPWEMKSWQGREKGILRKALEGILPNDVLYRKKSPYPKTHNPSYTEAARRWLMQVLDDPNSPILALIDVAEVRKLAAEDASATGTPWFGQLMGRPQMFAYLASIDYWLREYRVSVRL